MLPTLEFVRSGNLGSYKNRYERLVDRVCGGIHIAFHHVPKCGGTSISRPFRIRFLLSQFKVEQDDAFDAVQVIRRHEDIYQALAETEQFRRNLFVYNMVMGKHFVQGHTYFSSRIHQAFAERYKFITILRDPVERYLSHYYFDLNKNTYMGIREPLEVFVETERGRKAGLIFARYFGDWSDNKTLDTATLVARAKENLHKFAAVGRIENLAPFEHQLRANVGIRVGFGHANKGEARENEREPLPAALRARIEALCASDQEIFDYVGRTWG